MCQGVVPTCQQTSCSPSQKPSGNFSVCPRERGGERGCAGQAAEVLRLVTGSRAARSPRGRAHGGGGGEGGVSLTEEAVLMDFTAASNTFFGSLRLVVPLSTILLS